MMLRKWILLLIITACLAACQKEESSTTNEANLSLQLSHKANGQPLQMGATYTNAFGEDFTVSKFKYYISNIVLLQAGKTIVLPQTYYLVDDAIDSTKTINVTIPKGTYTGLQMMIGVDSTRNVSGAQTGALDPTLDMFWTWNSGYIMAKMEGTSSFSAAPNNRIQYHIGGFSGANSSLRTLQILFPASVMATDTVQINIAAELQNWFNGVHNLPIAQTAVSMTPGTLSAQYADNYASMFALTEVLIK